MCLGFNQMQQQALSVIRREGSTAVWLAVLLEDKAVELCRVTEAATLSQNQYQELCYNKQGEGGTAT